ncbi:MAG: integrase arm-type DNA-binding domain-containing protein [Gammaproteobacteria bacterium]|nr:integrase arm-type DNA-binding domain-containing protein [Gammaproteobacteria bacterium]
MSLTDTNCKASKPKDKPYKLSDGNGMYLLVQPNGSRYWRMKYRIAGKEKLLALGIYPETTLAIARNKCLEARKLLTQDKDPSQAKKDTKRLNRIKSANNFEAVAREWHSKQSKIWVPRHADYVIRRLEIDIFPAVGHRSISEIDPPELLEVLRKIEVRGAHEIAHRVMQSCGQVFRYAIASGIARHNPASELKGALVPVKHSHYAAMDAKDLPGFLKKLASNEARLFPQTQIAVELLLLTFVRTSELILAKWSEFDLENALWIIPAERMKMRRDHIVPLSTQVVDLLYKLKAINGDKEYILTGWANNNKPMSNGAILMAIRRMGYKEKTTGHGFRALAMTVIKENLGYPHEIVDRQLTHAPKSKNDAAYDRAKFLGQRAKMMQDWGHYLERHAKH